MMNYVNTPRTVDVTASGMGYQPGDNYVHTGPDGQWTCTTVAEDGTVPLYGCHNPWEEPAQSQCSPYETIEKCGCGGASGTGAGGEDCPDCEGLEAQVNEALQEALTAE